MANATSSRSPSRSAPAQVPQRSLAPGQSWQLPVLLLSLALFGYAAYLFIDPKPGPTVEARIESARVYLRQERPEAGNEVLNKLLKTERLDRKQQGTIHLLLADSLEAFQRQKNLDLIGNHEKIVEQTLLAKNCEIELSAVDYQRLATSYERLGKSTEALANYRTALALDKDRELSLHRHVIELLIDDNQAVSAMDEIDRYLAIADVADAERAWALGAKAQILIDRDRFAEARVLLDRAEKLAISSTPQQQGTLAYRLGYAAWKTRDDDEAERQFLLARELLGIGDPLDADATYALAKIAIDRNLLDPAGVYLQSILVSHPDSKYAPLAKLERGIVRAKQGQDGLALEDLGDTVRLIESDRARYKPLRETTIQALQQSAEMLANRGNYVGTIELMAREQTLEPSPPPAFFTRLAEVFQARSQQLDLAATQTSGVDQLKLKQDARAMLSRAGQAFVAHARKIEPSDERGYGESLWKGIDSFDRAGDAPASIDALELFIADRPTDPLAPDALLRLGRTYQAIGAFDKAIAAFTRNQADYPNSLAASKSAVPLAESLLAKGPENDAMAERVLISVVDENRLITPESSEFRQALFELGQICYRGGRFDSAIARLENFIERYPDDDRKGQIRFMMADSYRKSATALGDRLTTIDAGTAVAAASGQPADRVELVVARRERLRKAKSMFDGVVDLYKDAPPAGDLEQMYQRLAYFYRADCVFDLMDYAEAVGLYDAAARRYQNDPSALAAYVQIVNSYVALGKPTEARAANERAKWLLERLPPEAFDGKTFNVSRQNWQSWLAFTGESGLWAKPIAERQMAAGN